MESLYRACYAGQNKSIFHTWLPDGSAIVEFEDGHCGIFPAYSVRFVEPLFKKINKWSKD